MSRKPAVLDFNACPTAAVRREPNLDFAGAPWVGLGAMTGGHMPPEDDLLRRYPAKHTTDINPKSFRSPFPKHDALAAFQVEILHAFAGISVFARPPAGEIMPEFLVGRGRRKIDGDARMGNIVAGESFYGTWMDRHGAKPHLDG